MRLASRCLLLLAPALLAAPEKPEKPCISPALDLLPEGSTLKDVSLPRYDKDKKPSALLRADLMKVVSKQHVSGQNVELRVFEPGGATKIKVHMGAADYHVDTGHLEATEILTLEGYNFNARGSGAIFHLEGRSGFLYGPVTTTFTETTNEKTTTMNLRPASLTTLAFLGLTGFSLAEPPEALSPDELVLLNERGKPAAGVLASQTGTIKRGLIGTDQLAQSADLSLRTFVKEVQRPELLTIAADAPKPEPDPEPKIDPAKTTTITCAGGLFFDVEKSHVVYLKDVVVKKPDFTLTAGKELKVFLAKKAVKEGEEKPDGIGAFDDIETIVATGGIKVTRKDDKGQLLTATADTATYDAKSGDIVLRGGFPRVQQGPNFVRALEPGLYVRIYANGKGFFEEGKWETSLVNPDKGKKPN